MIEKLKNAADAVSRFLIYIVSPLALIAGYIYYLLRKEKTLEDKIEFMTKDERQKQLEMQVKEDEKETSSTGADYERIRDEYLKQSGGKLPPDHSGR